MRADRSPGATSDLADANQRDDETRDRRGYVTRQVDRMSLWQHRHSEPPSAQRPSVWVLDDSPTELTMVANALSESFDLRLFADGATLLEALMAAQPQALVLDWHLPEISGLEVLRMVRESYDEVTMPVLILTASGNRERDVLEALDAGANDFATKPYAGAEVRARLATLVRVRLLHDRARQAELAHQEARAELQTRADFEQQLIGIVSHDLRTPMGAIALGTQLLQMDTSLSLSPRQSKTLDRIRSSAKRAARMLTDLLDFTAVRLGNGLPMSLSPTTLDQLSRDVVAEVAMAYPARRLAFTPGAACEGSWDSDRISQVITNLVSNALHHGAADKDVHVETAADEHWGIIVVRNEGAPIPPELMARLFLPMERGADENRASKSSVGLGLFIVDHIVRAHRGTIQVSSTAHEGTAFTVRLPLQRPAVELPR